MKKKKGPFTSEIWNDIAKLKDPDKWHHLTELAKGCKKTPVITEIRFDLATKLGILIKKGVGRKIFFKLNAEDSRVKQMLKNLNNKNKK